MAKVGRPKSIKSPEEMYELFTRYKKFCKSNPFKVKDWVGGMGKPVTRLKERPLTMEGFECFGWDNRITIEHYFYNKDNAYQEFCGICSRIKREIRDEQIAGGMAGLYNPSITQRLNSLVEKTDNKHGVSEIIIKREG